MPHGRPIAYAGGVPPQQSPRSRGRFDFDAFAELYDDAIIDAIERGSGEPNTVAAHLSAHRPPDADRANRNRGSSTVATVGMVAAGLFRGVDAALDPEDKEPIVDFIDEDDSELQQPVTVYLVPGNPKASIAIVRHWLLKPAAGG